jgi:hypothetical protein
MLETHHILVEIGLMFAVVNLFREFMTDETMFKWFAFTNSMLAIILIVVVADPLFAAWGGHVHNGITLFRSALVLYRRNSIHCHVDV